MRHFQSGQTVSFKSKHMKTIHHPKDITVGKLYKVNQYNYRDTILYLGAYNTTTHEKFLIIVVDECSSSSNTCLGRTVATPTDEPNCFWNKGFVEQDA